MTSKALEFHADQAAAFDTLARSDPGAAAQLGAGVAVLYTVLRNLNPVRSSLKADHPHTISRLVLAKDAAYQLPPRKFLPFEKAISDTVDVRTEVGIPTSPFANALLGVSATEDPTMGREKVKKNIRQYFSDARAELKLVKSRLEQIMPRFITPFPMYSGPVFPVAGRRARPTDPTEGAADPPKV